MLITHQLPRPVQKGHNTRDDKERKQRETIKFSQLQLRIRESETVESPGVTEHSRQRISLPTSLLKGLRTCLYGI